MTMIEEKIGPNNRLEKSIDFTSYSLGNYSTVEKQVDHLLDNQPQKKKKFGNNYNFLKHLTGKLILISINLNLKKCIHTT